MFNARRSIAIYSYYLFFTGFVTIVAPAQVGSGLGLAAPQEFYARVCGILAVVLGYYYWTSARHNLVPMYKAFVHGRFFVLAGYVGIWLAGWAPPQIVAMGLTDLLGAVWTLVALRREARTTAPT